MAESGRQALVLQVADLVRIVDNGHLLGCLTDLDTETLTRMARMLTHKTDTQSSQIGAEPHR